LTSPRRTPLTGWLIRVADFCSSVCMRLFHTGRIPWISFFSSFRLISSLGVLECAVLLSQPQFMAAFWQFSQPHLLPLFTLGTRLALGLQLMGTRGRLGDVLEWTRKKCVLCERCSQCVILSSYYFVLAEEPKGT
jgi:hypothetical protein